jgi:hypothetical protein
MRNALPVPYSRTGLARLALSEQARDLADASRSLVPTASDGDVADGGFVEAAVRVAEIAGQLVALAVIYERNKGIDWAHIGRALGLDDPKAAEERFGQAERDFRERILRAWLQPQRAGEQPPTFDHFAQLVDRLNGWLAAHRELDPAAHADRSIAAGLEPTSAAERSALISEANRLVEAMADDPAIDDRQRHDLELGLCYRKIELYQELAAQGHGDSDVLTALAAAWRRLAELQGGTRN